MNKTPDADDLFSPAGAAELVRTKTNPCSKDTVRNAIIRGDLYAVPVMGAGLVRTTWSIRFEDLMDWSRKREANKAGV